MAAAESDCAFAEVTPPGGHRGGVFFRAYLIVVIPVSRARLHLQMDRTGEREHRPPAEELGIRPIVRDRKIVFGFIVWEKGPAALKAPYFERRGYSQMFTHAQPVACSPGGKSAFTRVFNALWRNPGSVALQ